MNKLINFNRYFLKNNKKYTHTRKNILIVLILFTLFLGLSAVSYAQSVSTNLSKSVFRLHVIANSDSEEDQNLKYKVRDSLISYMNTL